MNRFPKVERLVAVADGGTVCSEEPRDKEKEKNREKRVEDGRV
jgi:hypothetical protein